MNKKILHITFYILLFSSCRRDSEIPSPDFGYNYFPIDIGRYVIYQVDSIAYDDKIHLPDTTRYQLMEKITSVFQDNSGRPTLRIERYKKFYNPTIPYDSLPWTLTDVWFANRTTTTAEKVEENIRYIKLVFPVKQGRQWNGNSYNTLGQKDYEMISVNQSGSINSITFDSVLTVKQFQQIDFIQYRYELEKYAKNVGLIYKERDSIYTGGTADTVGYTFTQKIISYGK
jgi:hypothetical protein